MVASRDGHSASLTSRPTLPVADPTRGLDVAVVIPCYNEEATIAKVIADFRAALPAATIYVYDNNSSDLTSQLADAAGAVVRFEPLRGKGNVVRRMFADIQADVFIMVDGDDTYDATSAPAMLDALVEQGADIVTGTRQATEKAAYPPGHELGNRVLAVIVRSLFGDRCADLLSGYRVMTSRFVKSFPALVSGFEVETALTVHALELRLVMVDVPVAYRERPPGSVSKLRTIPDGIRVVRTIQSLMRYERPLPFYGFLAAIAAGLSLVLGAVVTADFLATGLVERMPSAILAVGLMLTALIMVAIGVLADSDARSRVELRRLHYLTHPSLCHRATSSPASDQA